MADSLTPQFPCANTEQRVGAGKIACPRQASSVCAGCFLVQYCSKSCQIAHRWIHKIDCKSPLMKSTWKPGWDVEHRTPDFISGDNDGLAETMVQYGALKYLWGNVPALDILNWKRNEGESLASPLRFLFAASGDIRNVVNTLAELPTVFTGSCDAIINDKDFDIVARNVILLLTALHFGPEKAVPIMIQLWYSALIPSEMFHSLGENVLPMIEDVCSKIRDKPAKSLQAKTWKYGSRTLRLVLAKEQWCFLPSYLQVPTALTAAQAQKIRISTTLAPSRKDYLDRALYSLPPGWRVAMMRFRADGILLPFGWSKETFDTPNPTFFQKHDFWPMMDSADPIEGWSVKEWGLAASNAKNDIYGSLYFYLHKVFGQFCRRIGGLEINFQIFHVDAVELPTIVKNSRNSFDRIEVSNITDRVYVGPYQTLLTFGPLLKRKANNPHATLLLLFLNATHEIHAAKSPSAIKASMHSEMKQLSRYLKPGLAIPNNPDVVKLMQAVSIFRDYDALFETFMKQCTFDQIALASGLTMKNEHTIVEKWPMRLRKGAKQEEFNELLASSCTGSERYVELRVSQ